MWGDDFDAILAILEEDEAIDHHFTSVINSGLLHLQSAACLCGWK